VLKRLLDAGIRWEDPPRMTPEQGKLSGQTFVLTGTLKSMTRDEAKKRLQALGAKIASSISKNTTYVVVGGDPGSKLARAEQLGVPLLKEQALVDLLKRG